VILPDITEDCIMITTECIFDRPDLHKLDYDFEFNSSSILVINDIM